MNNASSIITKIVHVLAALLAVLLIAQVALMFLPSLTLTPPESKVNPNPQPTDFTFMQFCWTDTEDITQCLQLLNKKVKVNDYVVDLVLSMVLAIATVIFTIMESIYTITNHKTGGAITIRILAYAAGFAWAYFSFIEFFDGRIFKYTNATGNMVQSICQIIAIVGLVIVGARMVLALLAKYAFKKKVA